MVTIAELWAPILASAVFVFVASALLWMVLPFHKSDYRPLPDETAVVEALRRQTTEPGQYVIPYAADQAAMKDPGYVKRIEQGPVGFLTLARPGPVRMGRNLGLWFLHALAISLFVAYLASRTLPAGTEYLQVFRVAGTTAFLAYAAAMVPTGIWWSRPWKAVWKDVLDGLVYALLTAGTFGWLWPAS
jgi:hypothetical protein